MATRVSKFLGGLLAASTKLNLGSIAQTFNSTLHLESRSVMCNGAEEKQAHGCDSYGLRVQEQPLFMVCSRIIFFTPMDQAP